MALDEPAALVDLLELAGRDGGDLRALARQQVDERSAASRLETPPGRSAGHPHDPGDPVLIEEAPALDRPGEDAVAQPGVDLLAAGASVAIAGN